jgi:hypothetical protein
MTQHPGGEEFVVHLVALPSDDAPAHVRLRTWLKSALRAACMRGTSVRQLPATPGVACGGQNEAGPATGNPGGERPV